jgi:dTDP-4-dehydrorhamnose 3,5-epimerase
MIFRTPLRRIPTPKGEVRHGLRADEPAFAGFGEVYFSEILPGEMKGWKRHRVMTMNLIVVSGTVRFHLHETDATRQSYLLSAETDADYARLTVPPGWWMAFEGLGRGTNLIMNLASHIHDPTEAENLDISAFKISARV